MAKIAVAPLVGARIEIEQFGLTKWNKLVAPLVGARIEIEHWCCCCGFCFVAPLVGARIEIRRIADTSACD